MTANQIEERARKAHVKIKDLLTRSGVSRVTWWRWTTGKFRPRSGTVEALIETLKNIEHSK
jgi:predicted transcriptional regulator